MTGRVQLGLLYATVHNTRRTRKVKKKKRGKEDGSKRKKKIKARKAKPIQTNNEEKIVGDKKWGDSFRGHPWAQQKPSKKSWGSSPNKKGQTLMARRVAMAKRA